METVSTIFQEVESFLRLYVSWVAGMAPGGQVVKFILVSIATVLIISSVASIVRRLIFMKSRGLQNGESDKLSKTLEYRRQGSGYVSVGSIESEISRAALKIYVVETFSDACVRFLNYFGSHFLTRRGISPLRAATVANVLLSVVIAGLGWPDIESRNQWVEDSLDAYGDLTDWVASSAALVTILLAVVTMWVFAGRAPIVDSVRARTQAASKASEGLLKVSASVYDLYLNVASLSKTLRLDLDRLTDEVVRDCSARRYEWFGESIREATPVRHQNSVDCKSFAEVESCIASLNRDIESLRRNGVDMVAVRLSGAAGDHLDRADINIGNARLGERFLLRSYWPLDLLRTRVSNTLPWFWKEGTDYEERARAKDIEHTLRQSAVKLRANSISTLLDIKIKEHHLYAAANCFERVKSGGVLVRILSARYKI